MIFQFDSNYVHGIYCGLKNPGSVENRKTFETALGTFMETFAYAQTNSISIPPFAIRNFVGHSVTYRSVECKQYNGLLRAHRIALSRASAAVAFYRLHSFQNERYFKKYRTSKIFEKAISFWN